MSQDSSSVIVPQVFADDRASSNQLYLELLSLSEKLTDLVAKDRIQLNCKTAPIRETFNGLPKADQEAYVDRFRFFVTVIDEASDLEPFNEQRYTWHVLKKLKVRPPSDLFSVVEASDYIEIYDRYGVQIFRNFGFCQLVSYSLHEILLNPWTTLYDRAPEITGQIANAIGRVMGATKTITDLGIDDHWAREKTPGVNRVYEVSMKYFAPLFGDSKEPQFFIAGSSIKLISS